ncbi:1481_t:CDS:2 [Funneliformis caledonium]|uniref:1481_t:CDS:1 n=1 Tax=Funneliformis caledonium TaxID=1117310 RepID=A0A9N9CGP9_9GLOM|nr:1481_t:CDS:2 [Funneliformis caledonium]
MKLKRYRKISQPQYRLTLFSNGLLPRPRDDVALYEITAVIADDAVKTSINKKNFLGDFKIPDGRMRLQYPNYDRSSSSGCSSKRQTKSCAQLVVLNVARFCISASSTISKLTMDHLNISK